MENSKDKKISLELLRFLVTGIVCALLDFLICKLLLAACGGLPSWAANVISTICGFIVGVTVNYLLSTYWVFKNVRDKNASKKPLFIVFFVLLSAVGLALSIGTMLLCEYCCKTWWNIDITKVDLKQLFSFQFWSDPVFWAYFVSFCIRTLVGLIWNYFTRKYILYKAPKEDKITIEEKK